MPSARLHLGLDEILLVPRSAVLEVDDREHAERLLWLAADGPGGEAQLRELATSCGCRDDQELSVLIPTLAGKLVEGELRIVRTERELPALDPRPRGDPLRPRVDPRPDDPRADELVEATFVLEDEQKRPVAGEPFVVRFSDGTQREGVLDTVGFAKISFRKGLTCELTFPNREGETWS